MLYYNKETNRSLFVVLKAQNTYFFTLRIHFAFLIIGEYHEIQVAPETVYEYSIYMLISKDYTMTP